MTDVQKLMLLCITAFFLIIAFAMVFIVFAVRHADMVTVNYAMVANEEIGVTLRDCRSVETVNRHPSVDLQDLDTYHSRGWVCYTDGENIQVVAKGHFRPLFFPVELLEG